MPRLLDLFDRHQILMTSFMIGDAVRRRPDVAAEIVRRGHEAAAHGRRWEPEYQLPRAQEKEWIADSFDFSGFSPAAYEQQLIDEFDQLYAEGAHRRRMMVIGLHERISGHPSLVRALDRIFTRLRDHEDVWWARKD